MLEVAIAKQTFALIRACLLVCLCSISRSMITQMIRFPTNCRFLTLESHAPEGYSTCYPSMRMRQMVTCVRVCVCVGPRELITKIRDRR